MTLNDSLSVFPQEHFTFLKWSSSSKVWRKYFLSSWLPHLRQERCKQSPCVSVIPNSNSLYPLINVMKLYVKSFLILFSKFTRCRMFADFMNKMVTIPPFIKVRGGTRTSLVPPSKHLVSPKTMRVQILHTIYSFEDHTGRPRNVSWFYRRQTIRA